MTPTRIISLSRLAAVAIFILSGAGARAAPPAAPAPVGAEPQTTSATYGDWALRCQRADGATQNQRVCEVAESLRLQGQQGVIAQIAIGRVDAKDPMLMTIALPSNISFPSVVKASIDDKDAQPIDLVWRRCLPGGCFADVELKEDVLRRWKSQTGAGRLQFKDATGRDVVLPFSFRGLSQALDGLAKIAS